MLLYTVAVVSGSLDEKRRIDAVNLAMVALAVLYVAWLLVPKTFELLKAFEAAGLKVELRERVHEMEKKVSAQERRIEQLIQIAMSPIIFGHLCGIACCKQYLYQHLTLFQREIYYLKDHGLIAPNSGFERIEFDEGFDKRNIVDVAKPTEAGWAIISDRA